MMRQFTMELRVDFADEAKKEVMSKAWRTAARHVFAQAALLSDGQKPQIALFSDDFYEGHEDIALLDDVLGNAIAADGGQETPVSSELMALANGKP